MSGNRPMMPGPTESNGVGLPGMVGTSWNIHHSSVRRTSGMTMISAIVRLSRRIWVRTRSAVAAVS